MIAGAGKTVLAMIHGEERAAHETGRIAYGFEVDKGFYTAAKEKMLANMAIPLFT